jgi:uncharacterized membrane protein YesL
MNLLWLVSVLTIIGGPPATAAMLAIARDAIVFEGGEPRRFFPYMRQYFWRAWALGLVTFLGTVILVTDIGFYANAVKDPLLGNTGILLLVYVLIVWLEFLLVAWPILVNHPEMSIRDVMRNAAIFTLRMPGVNFGLALMVILLYVSSALFSVLLALAVVAFVSLLVQHYLYLQAPALANFPPLPGEGATEPGIEEDRSPLRW